MIEICTTAEFETWLKGLRDREAKARIAIRLRRATLGNLGDVKFFDGIGEMRISYGPGYRLYFVRQGAVVVLLLCGGDKSSQERDIKAALKLAKEI